MIFRRRVKKQSRERRRDKGKKEGGIVEDLGRSYGRIKGGIKVEKRVEILPLPVFLPVASRVAVAPALTSPWFLGVRSVIIELLLLGNCGIKTLIGVL